MLKIWIQKVRSCPRRDDHWNQQFHMDFRRLRIGPMHIKSSLFKICMQLPSVPVKTTAVLCVLSWSEDVIDNRDGCYGDRHLSKKWEYVTRRTSDYEKFGFIQKRKYSPENHSFIRAYCPRTRSSRRNWIWGQVKTTAGITYNFLDSIQTGQQKRIILDLIVINGPLLVSDFLKQRLLLSSLQDSKKEKNLS